MHDLSKYRHSSVFKDESRLDINYVPSRLPHREIQLNLLNHFFRFALENPGKMAQRVLITGRIGTGKTVLSQRFGFTVTKKAEKRGINLHYVHVNCRECRGSLFMILQRPIMKFHPNFPKRGYRPEELLQTLMQILDDHDAYLILTMDELEFLIRTEGSDPLYNLSRVQEDRLTAPQRLSLICVLREPKHLETLDPSTRSTLQRNAISLEEYSQPQLQDILRDRVALSFRGGTVSEEILSFIAELAVAEESDARYALDLLWRAGKYADASGSPEVFPEAVRKAAVSVYPVLRKDFISTLDLHQKLLILAIARRFKQTGIVYISMGEAETAYSVVCEEYGEKQRGHTQLWKYLQEISDLGVIGTKLSGVGQRGKTTLISLPRVPAVDLEKELLNILYSKNGR